MAPPRSGGGPAAPASAGLAIDPMRIARTYWPFLVGAFVLSIVIGIGVYLGLGRFLPRFTSFAQFQVLPAASEDTSIATLTNRDEIDRYMETQIRVMLSDRILLDTIDTNEVRNTKWIQKYGTAGAIDIREALQDLKEMVRANVIPDTTIIQLQVTTSNPGDAQAIGQVIQTRFVRDNESQQSGDVNDRLQDVNARLTDLNAALESVEQSITALTRSEGLDSLTTAQSEAATEIGQLQPRLVGVAATLAELEESLAQRERLLRGQENFNPNDTPVGFVYPESTRGAAMQSPIVAELEQQIAFIEAEIETQSTRFGDNHPSIRLLRNRLRAIESQRAEELQTAMANIFSAELEGIRDAIPRLQATEQKLTDDLNKATTRQNELSIALQEIDNLAGQRTRYLATIADLDTKREQYRIMLQRAGRMRVIAPASRPDRRSFPTLVPVVGATIVLVTGFAAGLVLLRELREQRIRTPQDVAHIPRTRVLGILPAAPMDPMRPERVELACSEAPEGAIAESVRQLRSAVLQALEDRALKTVLIGSGMPGSGSTTVVSNLAISIASTGRSVLVIDANLRRPALHTVFDLAEGPGLSEVLREESTLEESIADRVDGIDGLHVLPAGTQRKHAYERFLSDAMESLLDRVRGMYDVVLIDVSPGVVSSDMQALANYTDATVLVAKAYAEKKGLVARLRNQLAVTGSEFLGVVVNAIKPSAGGYYKRNFEQSIAYHQPKRVKNVAKDSDDDRSDDKKGKKGKKKFRGTEQADEATASLPEPSDDS